MFQIAGGIILAVIVLSIINGLLSDVGKTKSNLELNIEKERKLRDQDLVEEGRTKHAEWEKKHPFAKHLYSYNPAKYKASQRR